jgi:membrane protease YdiL (CAAX protease family)
MTPADHLFAIYLVVSSVLTGPFRMRRLRALDGATTRSRTYAMVVLQQWARTVFCVVMWLWLRRPFADLGLAFEANTATIGATLGLAVIVVVMLRQRRQALADPEGRDEIRERLGSTRPLLPHSRAEFRGFAVVAITAGICEEVLFRGYLTWYFAHVMPWWAAMLAAALAFGLGHAYQGARGVLVTALVGLFLGAVYWLTGSLMLSMLMHALMDLHSGDLAWRVYESEADDFRPLRGPSQEAGAAGEGDPIDAA